MILSGEPGPDPPRNAGHGDLRPEDLDGVAYLRSLSRRGFLTGAALAASGVSAAFALLPDSAQAAGGYQRPCGNVPISSSWQDHRNRTPPSGEPGTDYAVGVGTPVAAATSGTIRYVKTDTSTATGRVVGMAHDDGNYSRHLHLSRITVATGQRVSRGQTIAYSGSSANGSDSGVGPHVHTSLWLNTGSPTNFRATVDFETYVGDVTHPNPPDREVDEVFIANVKGSWYLIVPQGTGKPRAVVLGGDSNAAGSGIPVLNFTWDPSIAALRAAVDGIG
ncbi:murein DD-endopeptidase MepM/ murein hydrolase activator NlpD [Allocatelliglobosispora scoriae]|uniref:Murein DD-endopeptidase MepM/ murein hydrolase activator NlpD n=1 Tax=Allocatelliglobosispora scoriae TaxID=643052 RepID=A0A841BL27_9ACTN|nr:M23 family metallopeptidase [Allocatelliglobosispora scoriae]MBB5867946.1 murein DD-endopeptidase MepM/ murein hydrolase activator NlpD [Allocatelliglobosispora scoriae]